jgi:hypothetical protein
LCQSAQERKIARRTRKGDSGGGEDGDGRAGQRALTESDVPGWCALARKADTDKLGRSGNQVDDAGLDLSSMGERENNNKIIK